MSWNGDEDMKRLLFTLTLVGLLAAACGGPGISDLPTTEPTSTQPTPTTPPVPPPTSTHIPVNIPPAQRAAVQALAAALGLSVDQIKLVSIEAVDWPDACLGIAQPGVVCAQVVTPGFIVVLEANGKQYEYHINADGRVVRMATLALTWHREGGIAGFCDDLTVYLSGEIQASSCRPGGKAADASLRVIASKEELAQFDKWITTFGTVTVTMKDPAVADAMTVTLTLNGSGKGQPTKAEKQAMIDWAQAVHNRLKP